MTTIADIRARLRKDLHDEDSANYRWTDGELDRHIQHTVREFSLAVPLEAKSTLTTTAGSREYPSGEYPTSYVRYSVWLSTLTLLVDRTPAAGEGVNIYWTKLHTIDGAGSTVPARFEDTIASGAAAYAALEWASFSTNRVNVGGRDVWREYLVWGQERLAGFQRSLARYGRRNAVRARRLYGPAMPAVNQTTVTGPP